MPNGGSLGYHCQHLYPVSDKSSEISTACLKGRDAAFLSAAQLLGLNGEIFALWNATSASRTIYWKPVKPASDEDSKDSDEDDDQDDDDDYRDFSDTVVFSKTWHADGGCYCVGGEYDLADECLDGSGIPCKAPAAIKFVNDRSEECFRTGMSVASYGNEPSTDAFYYTAAVVVQIPAAKDRNIPE